MVLNTPLLFIDKIYFVVLSVESPGVAFFAKNMPPENNPLIGSLAGSWPILVITLLLASLSGVIMWFLVSVMLDIFLIA